MWLTVAAGIKQTQCETAECECPQPVPLAVQSLQVTNRTQVQQLQAVVSNVHVGHLVYYL